MRVIYDGPLAGVNLTLPGERTPRRVGRGEGIEVPADFGASLIEQDIWNKAPAPRKAPAQTSEEDDGS